MMATNDKESSAAGTDNCPPMLEESDFESWKIRIERYIRGKSLGKLIWKSFKNGPTPHPTMTVTTGEGEEQIQVTREKTDEEFTEAENNKERADIQATNILSQGITRHIFNILNQTKTGKEIWENVELLMQGSVYQWNTKFINNLPSYWGKYVTIVKNSKDISTVRYVDLYTHLKSYEQHAMKTLSKMNQTSGNADPLAYMAQATQSSLYTPLQQYPQPITSSLSQYVPLLPRNTPALQQAPQSANDAMLATINQIMNMFSGFQKQFPPTNNHLRTSTNLMITSTIQASQITTESVQRRAPNKALLMEAKEKGVVLDAVAEAFLADVEYTVSYAEPLAITTTIAFEVSHEDAYDSDVDEAPHAAAALMANLILTGPSSGHSTSNDTDFHSEVQTYDNHFFDNMNLQVSQKIHRGEQLDSHIDPVIDDHDNTIPYQQYQLNNKVESVPTDVSSVIPGGISVITILDYLRSQLAGHIKVNEEQSFANDSLKAEPERYKTHVQNLKQSMSRDVLTVGSTMRIPLLYRGEYSQWVERFMNYLEEQMDGEAMINSIKNSDQPLPRVTQVSIAGTSSTEQPHLNDKSMCNSKLNKDVKQYYRKDLLSCNNSHLGETSSAYVCNYGMNVSCNSRLCDSFDENNLFIFDDESVRISPVSKIPFRKKPRDSLNIVQICLWIIDSRCSKHMTGNRALLTNFVEKFLRTDRFGNNDFAMIAGNEDVGLEVAFRKSTCFVRNEDGVDLLTGDRSSNLYTIALNEVASNS
nr:hypothetical protein [Tanacetum cinerariifolium]